jgi:hypothetical protein
LHGASAWARRALNIPKRRFPARAEAQKRAIAYRNRRQLKKEEARAAARREQLGTIQQSLLTFVHTGNRLSVWWRAVQKMRYDRAQDALADEKDAVAVISKFYHIVRFRKKARIMRQQYEGAAISIQKCFKVHAARRRMQRRKQAAEDLFDYLHAAQKTSLIKVSISRFRQACVTIQRFWRAKLFKKVAEMALLLKYWDARKQQLTQGRGQQVATPALGIRAPRNCFWGPGNILYTNSSYNICLEGGS